MKSVLTLAAAALAAAVWVGPARAAGPDFAAFNVQPYDPPKAAPPFALPDLNGKTVRLEDFKGKLVLLFFWATW